MSSGEGYIFHPLNTSKTKQTHCFPKESRFYGPRRIVTQAFYDLPSTNSKRTTGFGYGSKMDLVSKSPSPPPGSYKMPSDFQKSSYRNTPSIYEGRDKVTFGSFLLQAIKRTKGNPSPDRYNLPETKPNHGGLVGQRIKTDLELKYKQSIPGPGTYQLKATSIGQGSYFLSNYKNATSPRYFSDVKPREHLKKRNNSTVSYDIQEKQIGKYPSSKYKNTLSASFSRSKRQGLENSSILCTPGFKYRRFSEFGS